MAEVDSSEETKSMGHGAPMQTHVKWDWPSEGAHLSGPNKMIGQDGEGAIAELSG